MRVGRFAGVRNCRANGLHGDSRSATPLGDLAEEALADGTDIEQRITNRDEVDRMLRQLEGSEADVVRMYHLEGKTYQEISRTTGVPTNSVGPMLSRARSKLRQAGANQPHG